MRSRFEFNVRLDKTRGGKCVKWNEEWEIPREKLKDELENMVKEKVPVRLEMEGKTVKGYISKIEIVEEGRGYVVLKVSVDG